MTLTKSYNALIQSTNCTVPGFLDLLGQARTNATVTLWSADCHQSAAAAKTRRGWKVRCPLRGRRTRCELRTTRAPAAGCRAENNGTNADIISTNIGRAFVPRTPETFAHDADGNLTNDARWTYTWDAENRLTSFTRPGTAPEAAKVKVDCQYDGRGRRTQKVVSSWNGSAYVAQSTNRFLYDGWNLVGILTPDSSLLTTFNWGSDLSGTPQGAGGVGGLKSMTVHSGPLAGTYFYCYDGNGNVAALVAAADGSVAAQYEYGPFGEVIRVTGPLAQANPFLFSTKFCDSETGFYYYGYRYYDASTGRWPSRDPGGESLNPSVYAIANNDLLDFSGGLGGFITDDPTPTVPGIGVADRDTELGAAWCDLRKPVGSPMDTRNDNKTCGKACTQEHEDAHVKDRQSCCDKARAAFQASGADKKAVDKKYSDWHKATSDFTECRAYKVSGACYERLMKEKNCNHSGPTRAWNSCKPVDFLSKSAGQWFSEFKVSG